MTDSFYARTVRVGEYRGWDQSSHSEKGRHCPRSWNSLTLYARLPALLNRLRDLFDLNARPELNTEHFAKDKLWPP